MRLRFLLIFFLTLYRKKVIANIYENATKRKITKKMLTIVDYKLIKKLKNLSTINFYGIIILSNINFILSALMFFQKTFFFLSFDIFKKIRLFYIRTILFISLE